MLALNKKIVEIAKTPEMIARMREINVSTPIQTPEEVGKSLEQETILNGKLIVEAKISMD